MIHGQASRKSPALTVSYESFGADRRSAAGGPPHGKAGGTPARNIRVSDCSTKDFRRFRDRHLPQIFTQTVFGARIAIRVPDPTGSECLSCPIRVPRHAPERRAYHRRGRRGKALTGIVGARRRSPGRKALTGAEGAHWHRGRSPGGVVSGVLPTWRRGHPREKVMKRILAAVAGAILSVGAAVPSMAGDYEVNSCSDVNRVVERWRDHWCRSRNAPAGVSRAEHDDVCSYYKEAARSVRSDCSRSWERSCLSLAAGRGPAIQVWTSDRYNNSTAGFRCNY